MAVEPKEEGGVAWAGEGRCSDAGSKAGRRAREEGEESEEGEKDED